MAFKHKYSFEEKVKILQEYHTGVHGFRELCRIHYYINDFSKDLINLYQVVAVKDPEFFQSMEEVNEAWKAIEQLNILDLYNIYISYRNGSFFNA